MYDIDVTIYEDGLSGVLLHLGAEEVARYTVRDCLRGAGLPLGSCASRRFTLEFDAALAPGAACLSGKYVRVKLFDSSREGAVRSDKSTWADAGAWYISSAEIDKNRAVCRLSGSDALSSLFEARFADSASAYPRTLQNLIAALAAAAGTPLAGEGFYNGNLSLRRLPEWPRNVTLRRALGDAAFLAGGFARINYAGETEIVSCAGGSQVHIDADSCLLFRTEGGEPFRFNAILYRPEGESEYTRCAADALLPDAPTNALRAEGNALATPELIGGVAAQLAGVSFEGGSAKWMGGPLCQAGDILLVTDRDGGLHRLLISELTAELSAGGLSFSARSDMPRPMTGALTGGAKVFNADGTLSFEAIGEAEKRVLALSGAYISALTAEQIETGGLLAKFIDAARLRASQIDAQSVSTDELTSLFAEVLNASIGKLEAGTVVSDALTAALVTAMALKVEQLTAAGISSDRLASALARFQVLAAGTAEFDRATVSHMIASALNVSYGTGGEVFIENLAADYAALLRADVGKLCVRAADGEFYELNVDAQTGAVSAARTEVTDAEILSGETAGGRTILETDIAASRLSASSVKAVRALIGSLDASRVDADTLFARRAFVDELNTRDITSNSYLRLALGELSERIGGAEGSLEAALSEYEANEPLLEGLRRYITIDEDGMKQGREGSVYSTLVNESGFHILRRGKVSSVGSFDSEGLTTEGVTIGQIKARRTARGGWVWE